MFFAPASFGRIRFISYTKTGALLVTQKAVVELQGSYQVAVGRERQQSQSEDGERRRTNWWNVDY